METKKTISRGITKENFLNKVLELQEKVEKGDLNAFVIEFFVNGYKVGISSLASVVKRDSYSQRNTIKQLLFFDEKGDAIWDKCEVVEFNSDFVDRVFNLNPISDFTLKV